jgi:hypothetical protein
VGGVEIYCNKARKLQKQKEIQETWLGIPKIYYQTFTLQKLLKLSLYARKAYQSTFI